MSRFLRKKKAQTHNHGLEENRTENFVYPKPRQIAICRAAIEPWGWNSSSSSIDTSCRALKTDIFSA